MVSRTGAAREVVQSTGAFGAATTCGGLVMNSQEQPVVHSAVANSILV